jgi:protease-4
MWRDFTDEEQKILQQSIDEMYERFIRIVAENRPALNVETVRRLADGRIYTAKQALDHHLIDDILYLDDVIEQAKSQSHVTDASVVTYRRTSNFRGGIYSRSAPAVPQAAPQVNLLQINANGLFGPLRQPGFYYLWMP